MTNFFRFENQTIINATLVMRTALSVGSRASLLPAGSDLPVMKTPEGIPYIPGSSLKGVVRTYTERLLRTLDELGKKYQNQRLWACDPLSERERCVMGTCCERCEDCTGNCCPGCDRCKSCMVKRHKRDSALDDAAFAIELWSHSCTACRLFGSPWLASRVAFQDAMLENRDELLRLTEVRDGVGIDRDLGAAKTGIKYDFETVPAGASFGIRIIVENTEDWEVGLLLLALRAIQEDTLPLGGKTTRGLGWGALKNLAIRCVDKANLLGYLAGTTQPRTVTPEELLRTLTSALK